MSMKKSLYPMVVSIGLSILSLSACGRSAPNAQEQENPSASQAVPADTVLEGTETTAAESSVDGIQANPAANAASADTTQAEIPADAQSVSDAGSPEVSVEPSLTGGASVPQETLPANGLSEAEAKAAALEHAGVEETDVTGMLVKLETDDGILQYDVEFYAKDMEYDYEINAATGEILGFDHEWDHDHHHSQAGAAGNSADSGQFTREQAVALALSQVSGATQEHITKFKTDYDDGRLVYEIEIRYHNTECELEIDANTGQILELDFDD